MATAEAGTNQTSTAFSPGASLTVREVPALFKTSRKAGPTALPERIDLAAVQQADSSALALLLEWQSWARNQKRRVEFINPPQNLQVLATLCQISDLLGWPAANLERNNPASTDIENRT